MASTLVKSLARVARGCNSLSLAAEGRLCCPMALNVKLDSHQKLHSSKLHTAISIPESMMRICCPAIVNTRLDFSRKRHSMDTHSANSGNSGFNTRKLKPISNKREIIRYLRDEIRLESESQKTKVELPSVPGFEVTVDGSLLILTKDGDQESLKISVDVTDSLGREDTYNEDGEIDENIEPTFVAKPPFQVDIQRDEATLAFRCCFAAEVLEGDEDLFFIEQFFVHDGATNPQQFVGLPRFVGPELYDRFMSMLAERGIDNEFVGGLQELATAHEHRCYIRTLKDIIEFAAS